MITNSIDHLPHLLGCADLVCIDRPDIDFLQFEIAGEITESTFTGHEHAAFGRNAGNAVAQGA